jgi:hypothetical protein
MEPINSRGEAAQAPGETMPTTVQPNPAAEVVPRQERLEAARVDALARFRSAAEQLSAATTAVVAALTTMTAAAFEADYLSRRQGGAGAPEMRFADYLLGELRICTDHATASVTSPRDAVFEPARAAAKAKLAELRAATQE